MNRAARIVLWVLGAVLILFAVALVVGPWIGHPASDAVAKSLDVIIVAFVGILAKTGPHSPEGQ